MNKTLQAIGAPRRLKFEPVVTMGNVLSIIAMAGAVLTVYINLQVQLATQGTRINQIEDQLGDLREIAKSIVAMQIDIATIRALYQSQLQPPTHP